MSTVQAGDVIAVYRGGQLHNAPADMSTVQDTDLIVVGRGNVPYKCTVADWRASQGKPPAIYDVKLADSPQAGRFTSGTFASTVDMAEEGVPPATKGIKGWVEGSLKEAPISPAITAVNTATTPTSEIFNTSLHTGNSSTQTITNGIDLAGSGGLTWVKCRSAAGSHALFDTVRGATKWMRTNGADEQSTMAGGLTAFSSTGFTLGNDDTVNGTGKTYASWTFRKAPKFFDVVTYTGTGANRTIAHNLGIAPGFIIVKRTDAAAPWAVYHRGLTNATYALNLNTSDAQYPAGAYWAGTAPTSTVFSIGTNTDVNTLNGTYVAYLFAHETDPGGVIQCGNAVLNGTPVNLGWEPQWVLIKSKNSGAWYVYDNVRGTAKQLIPNQPWAETDSGSSVTFTPTGFQTNITGDDSIYIAIRNGGSVSGGSELTFGSNTGLSSFAAGDAVTEVLAAGGAGDAAGSVKSVDAANNKMTVNTSAGTWDVGNTVKGPMKTVQVTPTSDEIVAVSGTGSAGTAGTPGNTQYKTSSSVSSDAQSKIYGKTAQDANNDANHPAFQWATRLSIGGHTDWYIPAENELEILYRNLKPSTEANNTSFGVNPNAVPATSNYTSSDPPQTSLVMFRVGGPESFDTSGYWSATEDSSLTSAVRKDFGNGVQGGNPKNSNMSARAIRRVPFTGSEPAIGSAYEGGYFGGLISTAGDGVADYALIVAPNATGTYGYTGGSAFDPYVLTFSTDKDLTEFTAGTAVNQNDSAASGTVDSVDVTAKTMTMATGTGTGAWGPANTGKTVVGPTKPAANVKLFCTLDANLNVTDLQSPDPGFTAVTGAGPYTITFPATLPSGNPPDTDLPAGTTLTTEVQASNNAGTSDKKSTPITPA